MHFFGRARGRMPARAFMACAYAPRKRLTVLLLLLFSVVFFLAVLHATDTRFMRVDKMEQRFANMQAHLQFLNSLYQAQHEDINAMQGKVHSRNGNDTPHLPGHLYGVSSTTLAPEVTNLLKNMTGTRAAEGFKPQNLQVVRLPIVYTLLPHLINDPFSLRPAYHMKGRRSFADVVVGIPTVRRDKERYLMMTLSHLVNGLAKSDVNSTLIVVMVGETDLEYVLNTARQIESLFPKQVENGMIEVMSPSASYYPNFDTLAPTLGDSAKRFRWRTKQNLDTMYLMAYAQSKGTYYLMLEDDIVAKNDYMTHIKAFTAQTSIANPQWFFIEYCPVGGIGKLFRSSDLLHFITYVQLFYNKMPIDWLLESYLADTICTIEKSGKSCAKAKLSLRPKYKTSLFLHIGLYSSLKGKLQKVKDPQFGTIPTFFPHTNPALESIRSDVEEHAEHTLKKAYAGHSYFWGIKPKKGDVIEFWFEKPTALEGYTFRSSNVEHISDKFYSSVVEVLPMKSAENFTQVGAFDEFGLAEGELKKGLGPLHAIRIKVNRDSLYWVILSEIELRPMVPGE